jgi:integrase
MTSRDRARRSRNHRSSEPPASTSASLGDVARIIAAHRRLSASRQRDILSALNRTGELLGQELAAIPVDLPLLKAGLSVHLALSAGISQKTLMNIRSNLLAGIKASGLGAVEQSRGIVLSAGWQTLEKELRSKRHRFGLSRLARHCTGKRIEPADVDGAVLTQFIEALHQGTLRQSLHKMHRNVALIWNEVAEYSKIPLQRVPVPSFRHPAKRVDWSTLPSSFQKDAGDYLDWSSGIDPFAADARSRALAPLTVQLRRNHIHSAVTALIDSGVHPNSIKSLATLVITDNFTRILRQREKIAAGEKKAFNRDLARTLVEIARRWIKVKKAVLQELKRLEFAVPVPDPGLTKKNKAALRQFDDAECLRRLFELPGRLWTAVKRYSKPDYRTILKAQAALAVGILCYMPIRSKNLWALKFQRHIFLHFGRDAISSLELPEGETKNKDGLAFDIPEHLVKMLAQYRDRLVPKVFGRRFDVLFMKQDGSQKNQWSVARLIRLTIKKDAGLQLSPHQFRHLAALIGLEAEPGNFEGMKQLLGHKSIRTTVEFYAGINTRRAARHHQRLIDQALRGEAG